MDNIFVDTNIVLDLLQKREGFYEDAQKLFTLADTKQVNLFISALSIANTHYILFKHLKMEARKVLASFKTLVTILPLNDHILSMSFAADFTDFEDAIQYYTASENNLEMIITRNKKDFKNQILPILTLKEYLKQ
ncbi:MAG: PIN domain-containing protein [Sphingobacteriales bacterium]|nr:MAG: PIN domain-containing protein [Sphingobacteriales bacterium]